ncbi:hypothetical protein GGE35_005547 [Rhizobium cellulosilyticum]|uniref:Uncharacterized protein n=1 Tax=Aliirhizobium cellulosilyticum TaxID=393664 RepID=A0A7W6V5U5_9HYPH|nr:hypothetical protein [Rhizobium cellulosilyticum]MBB4414932.1 hypothetical protein [Rhizobium cellulosilyticum]MBB4449689.1 hypothetical protein [Rhizobium cellulosilyticum]
METATKDLQAINTAWQIAIQEILRMVKRTCTMGAGKLRSTPTSSESRKLPSTASRQT